MSQTVVNYVPILLLFGIATLLGAVMLALGAVVTVLGGLSTTKTDATGDFSFQLREGPVQLRATRFGYVDTEIATTVVAGEETVVDLPLTILPLALVEGVVTVRTISEGEARHYEEESRDGDPGAIRGPQREVAFTASGVRLLARGTRARDGAD